MLNKLSKSIIPVKYISHYNAMSSVRLADKDECAAGTAGCDMNAFCTNTDGSSLCACNAGYHGNGYTCTGRENAI